MSGTGMLPWDKEKITAVTPSKPNFFHVSLGEFLRFTLVILMRLFLKALI